MPVKLRTLEELLWDVSYYTMRDRVSFRKHVKELVAVPGSTYPPSSGANPAPSAYRVIQATQSEETTTDNLAHSFGRLSRPRRSRVILHSKNVEGGQWSTKNPGQRRRIPSGADLQFGIRMPGGFWISLLLQAKRLMVNGKGTAAYPKWEAAQNADLTRWASLNQHVPGMLLYNDRVAPFGTPGQPCTAFGLCSQASTLWGADSSTMKQRQGMLTPGTPGGVSLCFDTALLQTNSPTAQTIAPKHFPLEHLAHIQWALAAAGHPNLGGAAPSMGRTIAPQPVPPQGLADEDPTNTPDHHTHSEDAANVPPELVTFPDTPQWVTQLLQAEHIDPETGDDADSPSPNPEFFIRASVIIDLADDVED